MALRDRLNHTPFEKPLLLDSSQSAKNLTGDIHALIDYRFETVEAALGTASHWCDILTLHPNVKRCSVSKAEPESELTVCLGAKRDESLAMDHCVNLVYRVAATAADSLRVVLSANTGPFGTRNYRILLEAVPVDSARTFLHFSYSYLSSISATLALDSYLGTVGSGKVGFSVDKNRADGQPSLVRGMRGALERNTMRYYLAIEAYLDALSAPPDQQFERRLHDWFAAAERYPRQLHELEQDEYIEAKRKERSGR
jgi:hypothetical protein